MASTSSDDDERRPAPFDRRAFVIVYVWGVPYAADNSNDHHEDVISIVKHGRTDENRRNEQKEKKIRAYKKEVADETKWILTALSMRFGWQTRTELNFSFPSARENT